MKFCEKCGNLMFIEKIRKKSKFVCRKCGHVSNEKVTSASIKEKMEEDKEKILIVTENEPLSEYPKTKILCPECDNNEAYWYMQQTRGGDEPQTRFYSCTKCGHKWREY